MKEKIIVNKDYLLKDQNFLIEEAPLNYFYGKEVFFTSGFSKNKSILFQILGNLGAYANDYELDNSINVFVVSNSILESLEKGLKDKILETLETKLNSKGQPFKDLITITESSLIGFVEKRTSFYGDTATQELLNALAK
jgi:hypothetical protein